jgi:PII-like signaling protein
MDLSGPAKKLTIVVGEQDRAGHRRHSLATEIVHMAHASEIAGATVTRGIEGYGKSNHIHTTRILSLSDDLPLVVTIVDHAAAVERFVEQILPLVQGGLVTVEDVDVRHYVRHSEDDRSEPREPKS